MKLRFHEIPVSYDKDSFDELKHQLHEVLGSNFERVNHVQIIRRSIDARQRPVKILYGVDVEFDTDLSIPGGIKPQEREELRVPHGKELLSTQPLVIGGGPAGLFAALMLAEHGFSPLLIERGGPVVQRIDRNRSFFSNRNPDPECNVLFGLGGAGTFSDGKLTTGIRHKWLPNVLEILVQCGAPEDIRISAKPHIGTDILIDVVENMVQRIEKAGGTVKTGLRVDGISSEKGALRSIITGNLRISTQVAVLAIGHSARDTLQMLSHSGLEIVPKPFQMGVRVEHPQTWIDRARYGDGAGHEALGSADYKLATKVGSTPVFSFCMCPGGQTMPTISEAGYLALNGMSLRARNSAFSSSGLVVTLRPSDYGGVDLESCLSFQKKIEKRCFEAGGSDYTAPGQSLTDFAADRTPSSNLPPCSYRLGVTPTSLSRVLPEQVAVPLRQALSSFDARLPGYIHPESVVLAPESRASCPLRILRNPDTKESTKISGLYPAGEGAGYAGGIMSSALDGLDAATKIIERYRI